MYKIKYTFFGDIYIGSTQQTSKKIMDSLFSGVQRIIKNKQKSDSFSSHYKKHFKYTTYYTELVKRISFKEVKYINPIVSNKPFTKPNLNICIEERLTILYIYVIKIVIFMKNVGNIWDPLEKYDFPSIFNSQ